MRQRAASLPETAVSDDGQQVVQKLVDEWFSTVANSGKPSGKPAQKTSGKTSGKPEVESNFATSHDEDLPLMIDDEEIEFGEEIATTSKGWRLEKNSDGYFRWRWQKKDESGQPIIYITKSGKTGYKRGSKYVGKKENADI